MRCCNLNSVCCVYTSLIGNTLINIFILVILLLSCYNILILNIIQKIYLIISILYWMVLLFYSFFKLFSVLLGKFSEQILQKRKWFYVHIPGYLILAIALIYDLIKMIIQSGIGGLLFYYTGFFFFCCIFVILTISDYYGIQGQLELSRKKNYRFPLHEEKDKNKVIPKDINKIDIINKSQNISQDMSQDLSQQDINNNNNNILDKKNK